MCIPEQQPSSPYEAYVKPSFDLLSKLPRQKHGAAREARRQLTKVVDSHP
jgi:hypothetical protein